MVIACSVLVFNQFFSYKMLKVYIILLLATNDGMIFDIWLTMHLPHHFTPSSSSILINWTEIND